MQQKRRYSPYELWLARKRARCTIDDVKDALKLKSKSHVSEWENGKRYPTTKQLFYLAALYKTLESQLLYDLRMEAVAAIEEWQKKREMKLAENDIRKKPP